MTLVLVLEPSSPHRMVLLGLQGLLGHQMLFMESPTEIAHSWQMVLMEPSSPLRMEPIGLQGLLVQQKLSLGVTYGNSIFVMVGQSGTIMTSSDGTSWDNRTSGTSNGLYGVTYGNSTFVAVGHYETILTSSDGTTWTSRTSGRTNSSGLSYKNSSGWTYTDYLEGITYGNSIFVTVGRGEDGSGTIMTSSDGINWTSRTSGTTNNLWFVTHKE